MESRESFEKRKFSANGSTSSKSSSFFNIEENGTQSMASPSESNFGSVSDLFEVETVVNSDFDENFTENFHNHAVVSADSMLPDHLYVSLQGVFKKQDPKDPFFDIAFLIENKEIYAHMLVLHLRGAKKLLKYIESYGSGERIKKVDMSTVTVNTTITYEELFIFTKSLYFTNIGNDLTTANVMLLFNLGKQFGIQSLISDCQIFLKGSKWENDALTLLEKANSFSDDEMALKCLNIISKNTSIYLNSEKFLQIKRGTLKQLLQNRTFQTNAKTLFDKVYEWSKNACLYIEGETGDTCSFLGDILTLIPFEKMSDKDIFEIVYEKGMLTKEQGFDYLHQIWTRNNMAISATSFKSEPKNRETHNEHFNLGSPSMITQNMGQINLNEMSLRLIDYFYTVNGNDWNRVPKVSFSSLDGKIKIGSNKPIPLEKVKAAYMNKINFEKPIELLQSPLKR